jgi:hypothetical protein
MVCPRVYTIVWRQDDVTMKKKETAESKIPDPGTIQARRCGIRFPISALVLADCGREPRWHVASCRRVVYNRAVQSPVNIEVEWRQY